MVRTRDAAEEHMPSICAQSGPGVVRESRNLGWVIGLDRTQPDGTVAAIEGVIRSCTLECAGMRLAPRRMLDDGVTPSASSFIRS
jgi:hypothetical protein